MNGPTHSVTLDHPETHEALAAALASFDQTDETAAVVAVYADQNGTWDARDDRGRILAVGSRDDPQPACGAELPLPTCYRA